jgi:PTH2 family peptidyl-tRNA hydrolase
MKQVIIARTDLHMSPGKLAAQVAHAAIAAYKVADHKDIDAWERAGVTKVVLQCKGEKELLALYKQAVADYLPTSIICDEGRTEVKPGSITCVAIGPAKSEAINKITGALKLYGGKETKASDS